MAGFAVTIEGQFTSAIRQIQRNQEIRLSL